VTRHRGTPPPRPDTGIDPDDLVKLLARLRSPEAPWQGTTDLGPFVLDYQNPRAFASTVELIFRDGIYDVDPRGDQSPILDGGGWLGLSVLRWRQLFPEAPITVFEPDPEIFGLLCRNLERNNVSDVEPVCAALAGTGGERTFHATGSDSGGLVPVRDSRPLTVRTARLSPYLAKPASVLKLNIEGAEHEVVSELGDRLANANQVLIEYHGFAELPQTLHEILAALHHAGHTYVISHFNEHNAGCVPPLWLDEQYRYFLLVYARRVPGGTRER
jgi:FkbM family methyltransferase